MHALRSFPRFMFSPILCWATFCLGGIPAAESFHVPQIGPSMRESFQTQHPEILKFSTQLYEKSDSDEVVEVGTKEYYSGFLSSPIQDETVAERGTGLEQALKLAGSAIVVLVALVLGFMASNGLI